MTSSSVSDERANTKVAMSRTVVRGVVVKTFCQSPKEIWNLNLARPPINLHSSHHPRSVMCASRERVVVLILFLVRRERMYCAYRRQATRCCTNEPQLSSVFLFIRTRNHLKYFVSLGGREPEVVVFPFENTSTTLNDVFRDHGGGRSHRKCRVGRSRSK